MKGLIGILTAAVLTGCFFTDGDYYNTSKIIVRSTAEKSSFYSGAYNNNAAPGVHITWIYAPGYNADDAGNKTTLRKLTAMDGAQVRADVVNERTHYVDAGKTWQITFQVVTQNGGVWWATSTEFEAKSYRDYTFTFDGIEIVCSDKAIRFPSTNWIKARLGYCTDGDGDHQYWGENDTFTAYPGSDGAVDYDPVVDYGIGYAPWNGSYYPSLNTGIKPAEE